MTNLEIASSENKINIIRYSSLDQRIKWAKEGLFFEELYKDESELVRIEVANSGSLTYLEYLKNDVSTKVKIAVMKKTSYKFLSIDDFNDENIELLKEAIKLGLDVKELNLEDNDLIKLEILKEKGYLYCKNNGLLGDIEKETFEIQKIMIKEGESLNKVFVKGEIGKKYILKKDREYIINFFANSGYDVDVLKESILKGKTPFDLYKNNSYDFLFKDENFRNECIMSDLYLQKIIGLYIDSPEVIKLFLMRKLYNLFLIDSSYRCTLIEYLKEVMTIEYASVIFENDIEFFNETKYIKEKMKQIVINNYSGYKSKNINKNNKIIRL